VSRTAAVRSRKAAPEACSDRPEAARHSAAPPANSGADRCGDAECHCRTGSPAPGTRSGKRPALTLVSTRRHREPRRRAARTRAATDAESFGEPVAAGWRCNRFEIVSHGIHPRGCSERGWESEGQSRAMAPSLSGSRSKGVLRYCLASSPKPNLNQEYEKRRIRAQSARGSSQSSHYFEGEGSMGRSHSARAQRLHYVDRLSQTARDA
jgi:hypothetical protein